MANWKLCLLASIAGTLRYAGASEQVGGCDYTLKTTATSISYGNITSSLDQIIDRGYLKIGVTGDYKPFSYLVTNASTLPDATTINTTYIGADIDNGQSLSDALGLSHPVHIVPTTWSNITSDLMAGKFDIAMGGISITVERARSVFFSAPILRDGKTACFRCADAAKFTNLASIDVAGVTVIVNPGGTNEAFDRANLKSAKVLVAESNDVVYDRVLDGTADVMISDGTEVELQVALHPGKLCGIESGALFTFDQKAYIIRRDVPLKNFVDTWVDIQLGSGALNTTISKWMDFPWGAVQ